MPTPWTCASSSPSATNTGSSCSRCAGPTSKSTPAPSRPAAEPERPSPARLSTVAGFYRYAEDEGLIDHSPAVHVRRPRVDYESHAVALDRNELGALLVAAGLGFAPRPRPHLAAGAERTADLRSTRRRHRPARPGPRPPHPDHHPQRRQDRHHPTRTEDRPDRRFGRR